MISTKKKREVRTVSAIVLILFTFFFSFIGGMIVSSSWNTEAFAIRDALAVSSGALLLLATLMFSARVAQVWNAPIKMLLVILMCVAGGTYTGYVLIEIPTEIIGKVVVGSYLLVILFMVTCYRIEYFHKKYLGGKVFYP